MVKALGLLSGGLDSTLAAKLLLEQGIEIVGLNFVTPFCTCTRKGCIHSATRTAKKLGIKLRIINLGKDYIKIIKNPRYGYGRGMNPCIDCRIFMLKKAKNYMQKLDCKFVFTGEVLGQRPKSQKKDYLKIIERDSGLENLILRPLSAKLLAPTIPERKGFVNREKLLALRGRSRKEQMRLAENFSLDYPCPAGGCRLTQKEFAKKLKDAFRHEENTLQDMIILRYGRHFRLNSHAKVIVGRNDLENKVLEKLAGKKDLILEVVGYGSPITLLRSSLKEEDILLAGALCARYSDARTLPKVKVRVSSKEKENLRYLIVTPLEEAKVKKFRVT